MTSMSISTGQRPGAWRGLGFREQVDRLATPGSPPHLCTASVPPPPHLVELRRLCPPVFMFR